MTSNDASLLAWIIKWTSKMCYRTYSNEQFIMQHKNKTVKQFFYKVAIHRTAGLPSG